MCGENTQSGRGPDQSTIAREEALALHAEIEGLPSVFRVPVVLCYFEGLSLDEAAHRLGCPAGTLRSRLARARDKLRRGLTRRGVFLSASAIVSVLNLTTAARATVPSSLCETTTRAAISFAAGQAAGSFATRLAREVLGSMLVKKIALSTLAMVLAGAVATGARLVGDVPDLEAVIFLPHGPQVKKLAPGEVIARADDAVATPAPGRMFVVGRVLDPAGKPVPKATVMIYARSNPLGNAPLLDQLKPTVIGDTSADGSGRFRLDGPRVSSSRHDVFCAVALGPVTVWAILISIPMPISPPRTFCCDPSTSFMGGCLTCTVALRRT